MAIPRVSREGEEFFLRTIKDLRRQADKEGANTITIHYGNFPYGEPTMEFSFHTKESKQVLATFVLTEPTSWWG